LFKSAANVNVVRVNYKAGSQAVTDLVAGQTQFMFGVPASVMPHLGSGRLRALAITSEKRSALWPDLPAMAQTLPGYDVASRLAIFAPAGTPASIVKRLNEEIVRVLRRPDVKEKFVVTGVEPVGNSPESLAAIVKSEVERMGTIIKTARIRAD
jgi:tripartite-type tricarboxylate transporter receptor subunit TctC